MGLDWYAWRTGLVHQAVDQSVQGTSTLHVRHVMRLDASWTSTDADWYIAHPAGHNADDLLARRIIRGCHSLGHGAGRSVELCIGLWTVNLRE
jgi:hypothetical protein